MKNTGHVARKIVTQQRKKIYIIITIITLIMLTFTSALGTRILKNGLSLKGMLMTGLGQNQKDIENLEPFYCVIMGVSKDISVELTDTIILCAYYPNEEKVSMLSIPRDTYIGTNKKNADSFDKINALYQSSPEKTVSAVRNLTGVDVRNYVVISNEALREVVDAVDGIYFDVPIDMNYDDTSQDLHIHLNKGYQLLDGDKAEQLVRFRHNTDQTTYLKEYGTQDIGRMKTQREFLKAAASQILSGSNIFKLDEIMKVVFKNIKTNLTINDFIKYIPSITEFKTENIQSDVVPGGAQYLGLLSFYLSDEEKTNEVVSNLFGLSDTQIEKNKEKFANEDENGTNKTKNTKNNKNNKKTNNNNIRNNTNTNSVNINSSKKSRTETQRKSKQKITNKSKTSTNTVKTNKKEESTSSSAQTGVIPETEGINNKQDKDSEANGDEVE